MGPSDYFKSVPGWTAEQVAAFLRDHDVGSYELVDVRQPGEYEAGHLPGARLIPLPELKGRIGELDPGKPCITYCRSGVRSRVAATLLGDAGFPEVHSMQGGFNAWSRQGANGEYDAGMAYFSGASGAQELIALSFALEEGNRIFYETVARDALGGNVASVFQSLARAEERHKTALRELHRRSSGAEADPGPPAGIEPGGLLEGGIRMEEALEFVRKKPLSEALALAMALEANALDRYIKMSRTVADERSREVFLALAGEEKTHLDRIALVLDFERQR